MKSRIVTAGVKSSEVSLVNFVIMTEGLRLRRNSRRLPYGAYSTTIYRKPAPRRHSQKNYSTAKANTVTHMLFKLDYFRYVV